MNGLGSNFLQSNSPSPCVVGGRVTRWCGRVSRLKGRKEPGGGGGGWVELILVMLLYLYHCMWLYLLTSFSGEYLYGLRPLLTVARDLLRLIIGQRHTTHAHGGIHPKVTISMPYTIIWGKEKQRILILQPATIGYCTVSLFLIAHSSMCARYEQSVRIPPTARYITMTLQLMQLHGTRTSDDVHKYTFVAVYNYLLWEDPQVALHNHSSAIP